MTDVTINAYIGLLLCSTHTYRMQLHIARWHVEIMLINFPQSLWIKFDEE